ncbi:MAG: hypothetical protein ACJ747_05115 [Gaiellaceae bacterium]|jgi:redox-regulated HSP33 family molecular chaperone|nr:hypothetical protein [Acidobacteriota bacterium]
MASNAEATSQHGTHKRRLNELIHESLTEETEPRPIAFFCECDTERCFEAVWLSPAEYENRRAGDGSNVLALGH